MAAVLTSVCAIPITEARKRLSGLPLAWAVRVVAFTALIHKQLPQPSVSWATGLLQAYPTALSPPIGVNVRVGASQFPRVTSSGTSVVPKRAVSMFRLA